MLHPSSQDLCLVRELAGQPDLVDYTYYAGSCISTDMIYSYLFIFSSILLSDAVL